MAITGALKTFKGGHYFGRFEGAPRGPIESLPPPSRAVVPLRQGFRDEAALIVDVGDRVRTGQLIARSDELICTPVHAPISGEITAIEEGPHPLDGKTTTFVTVRSDGRDEWARLDVPEGNYEKWDAEELGRVLYEAGATALGKAGFPTPFHSSVVEPGDIDCLIVSAVETEPYLQGNMALLYEEFDKFVAGLKIVRGAIGNIEVHIGLPHDRARLFQELENRLQYYDWAYLHPLLPKYPQGADEVLIKTLLDGDVPAGELPTALGVIVCDVQQVVAGYEAVLEAKPFVERVVSIGGSGVARPANVRLRAGTLIDDVLEPFGHTPPARLVLGGPLRGTSVSDVEAPITRDVEALVALREPRKKLLGGFRPLFGSDSYTNAVPPIPDGTKRASTGLNGSPRPCIRCGDCVDVCPQNLFPLRLAEAVEDGDLARARELAIMACIECGLCSYVCPSKLPLLERIRTGKAAVREEELRL